MAKAFSASLGVDSKAVKFGGIFSLDRIVNSLFSNHTHTITANAISKIIEISSGDSVTRSNCYFSFAIKSKIMSLAILDLK